VGLMMKNTVSYKTYLKDVMICALGAYGGPEAHYGVFTDQLVIKKQYLSEEEFIELIALNSILPGPSSTQTIVSIGYKLGGVKLALLTMFVWAFPAIVIMTLLSFLYRFWLSTNTTFDGLALIGPMAVGFIATAAYRLGRKVIKNKLTLFLFIFGAVTTYFFRQSFVFAAVLLFGGVLSVLFSKEKFHLPTLKVKPKWGYLIALVLIAILGILLSNLLDFKLFIIFESFYRYGYLVIGGGQVVIPYMVSDLVDVYQYMTSTEFLTGFGFVQGIPGPMFSFSAFAGGMSLRDGTIFMQILAALTASTAIFLPGLLLVFFVYPMWEMIRTVHILKVALKGITAVAAGLIAIAALILMSKSGFQFINLFIFALTTLLLLSKKVPSPLIVILVIILGFIM
jgi:chromate transporter